jgi:hypothetical protein
MLLASNKQKPKEITKKEKTQQDKQKRTRTRTKWAYKKLPTYKTLYRIIQNTPNAEIPKKEFFLIGQPTSPL